VSEDIVQETFVHIWENYRRLSEHHERSIQFYLVKVVRNKSVSHFSNNLRTAKNKISYLGEQSVNPLEHTTETAIIQAELHNHIRRLVDSFPQREKQCLMMRIVDELTVEQIAERLKVSKKAVERSITSANRRLRKYGLQNGNKI
jgi:RNA polymerase sigma-70 factor (ECF subfamily)